MAFRSTPVAVPTFATPTASVDIGDPAVAGTGPFAASSQHQHAMLAPLANYVRALAAAASDGVLTAPARADHGHPHPASDHLAGGFADLTGQFAGRATAADHVQFVSRSANANDANDGLSLGSAKATIAAALAALPTVGGKPAGIVTLAYGTFPAAAGVLSGGRLASIIGPGSALCTVAVTGAGDGLRITEAGAGFSVQQAGALVGFTLAGDGTAGQIGLHLGDIVGAEIDDVVVQNFTGAGSVGVWFENTTHWTERISARRLHVNNCTTDIKFSVSGTGQISFGYNRFLDVRLTINNGQVGIQSLNNALLYNIDWAVIANLADAATLIRVDGTSTWQANRFYITAEQTSGVGGQGVLVANGASFWGYGLIRAPNLPHANANPAGTNGGLTFRILGSGEAQTDSNFNDLDATTVANFMGSGAAAAVRPIVAGQLANPLASFSELTGPNINSPLVTMFDFGGRNAFLVGKLAGGTALANFVELFRMGQDGSFRINQAASLFSGSGVPSNLIGANGDWYLRTDTPGTANQRLYSKSAGAWVGVV